MTSETQLTSLLQAWGKGDPEALDRIVPIIYGELRKLARFHMSREAPDHTLQPTALINEAFLKLVDLQQLDWKSRKHFYRAASQIMRNLLVDYARKKRSVKRGREAQRVPLEEAITQPANVAELDILSFDEAITRLAAKDSRKARVVECWFFAGMSVDEIARLMDIGESTVRRDLDFARVWLTRELKIIEAK